jgi:plastocyanin
MKSRRTSLAITALTAALALGVAACDGGASASEPVTDMDGAASVVVADNSFDAADLTVATGTTVTWQWADGASRHNVSGDGFTSPTQDAGSFAHHFDQPGRYDYRCTLHYGMDGTVTVEGG